MKSVNVRFLLELVDRIDRSMLAVADSVGIGFRSRDVQFNMWRWYVLPRVATQVWKP